MYIPSLGWTAIRPLQYGDLLRFYENADESPAQQAAVFRRTIVGFEDCTAADVGAMKPTLPAILELAVLRASDAIDGPDGPLGVDDTHDGMLPPDHPHAKPAPSEVDAPENSMWAAHNKSAREKAAESAALSDADLQYILHENNETTASIYQMLLAEMSLLFEGAERAADRREQATDDSPASVGGGGNRTDRAAQLGLR